MENEYRRTVTGVFSDRMKAVNEIKRLENLDYTQEEIIVYTSPNRAKTVERILGIGVRDVEPINPNEDLSWWNSIKNSFTYFAYEGEKEENKLRQIKKPAQNTESEESSLLTEEKTRSYIDFLKPYLKDINNDKLVIVVENYGRHNPTS